MAELLSKEQLDAVRSAVASLDQLYADHPQLRGSQENQILFESLTSNSVTIRALLAHIDAQAAEIERLRLALGEASRQVDFMPEEVADFLRGDTDDVEW